MKSQFINRKEERAVFLNRIAQAKRDEDRLYKPPQVKLNPEYKHKFRFNTNSSNSLVDYSITPNMILGAMGAICTVTNSAVSSCFGSFRINSIEMWGPYQGSGNPASTSVDWYGYQNSPNRVVSDSTVSESRPAHILTTPPRGSLASFWQTSGTNTLFDITCPVQGIVDLNVSFIQCDGNDNVPTNISIANGTLQEMYYLALDGPTSNKLTPVYLSTTH